VPLACEPAIPVDQLPRLPLFPGRSQHWSLALRSSTDDPDELEAVVRDALQQWLPLFDGPVTVPRIAGTEDLPGAVDRLPPLAGVEPPPLEVRDPAVLVSVRFDYLGTATAMRWPTLVRSRRERIDPLCPVAQVDVMPVAVGRAAAPLRSEVIEPRPPALDDPLDAGLPQLPPPAEIVEDVKGLFKFWPLALLAAAAGVGIYLGRKSHQ
jgi:hypothetical protein